MDNHYFVTEFFIYFNAQSVGRLVIGVVLNCVCMVLNIFTFLVFTQITSLEDRKKIP